MNDRMGNLGILFLLWARMDNPMGNLRTMQKIGLATKEDQMRNQEATSQTIIETITERIFISSQRKPKILFGFADYPGVDVVAGLEERIDLLKKVNSYEIGYKLVLPMAVEKGNNYVSNHKFTIRPKSLFLLKAYQIALDKMRVGVRWVDHMCHKEVRELNSYGIKTATHKEVVAKWNQDFRISDKFPHPNPSVRMGKKAKPVLFEVFSHLEARLQEFVMKHLD